MKAHWISLGLALIIFANGCSHGQHEEESSALPPPPLEESAPAATPPRNGPPTYTLNGPADGVQIERNRKIPRDKTRKKKRKKRRHRQY